MKKNIALFTIPLFFMILLTSCKSDQKESKEDNIYRVTTVYSPTVMKSDFVRFSIKYANWVYETDVNPDSVFNLLKEIETKQFGGTPMVGEFKITNEYVDFRPYSFVESFYKIKFKSMHIPTKDILKAEVMPNDGILITQRFKITTINGSVVFYKVARSAYDFTNIFGNSYHKEICKKINEIVTKNN